MVEAAVGLPPSLAELWNGRDRQLAASQAVYETVRTLILSGALAAGGRLGAEEFAKQLGVSRTPVREAFLRLEAERLVERHNSRNLVVASVDAEEILETYVVRIAMEGLSARLAAESARPQDIADLRWLNGRFREASEAGDVPAMAKRNLEFHEAIGKAGHNGFLLGLLSTVHDRVRRFPGTTLSRPDHASLAVKEHDDIIAAIQARDPELADQLSREHMTHALKVRIEMTRNG